MNSSDIVIFVVLAMIIVFVVFMLLKWMADDNGPIDGVKVRHYVDGIENETDGRIEDGLLFYDDDKRFTFLGDTAEEIKPPYTAEAGNMGLGTKFVKVYKVYDDNFTAGFDWCELISIEDEQVNKEDAEQYYDEDADGSKTPESQAKTRKKDPKVLKKIITLKACQISVTRNDLGKFTKGVALPEPQPLSDIRDFDVSASIHTVDGKEYEINPLEQCMNARGGMGNNHIVKVQDKQFARDMADTYSEAVKEGIKEGIYTMVGLVAILVIGAMFSNFITLGVLNLDNRNHLFTTVLILGILAFMAISQAMSIKNKLED